MKPYLLAAACVFVMAGSVSGEARSTQINSPALTSAPLTSGATVTFEFEREGMPVPRYKIVVHEDGNGIYKGEESERRSADSALQQVSLKQIERTISLSPAMVATIFASARSLNRFNMFCGTKAKNIANTGKKILRYGGPEGSGECTYNYSDDRNVTQLTGLFYGIAHTMDVGRRLDFERRFDRLGLDAEMLSLERCVEDKSALELGTIAPTLRAIAADEALMQRVRGRASKLLEEIAGAK